MKRGGTARNCQGFTLLELLFVVLIVGILMALLLPVLEKGKQRARQTECLSQLHQIGLGFHAFLHEHDSQFPWQVSTNAGGTREFVPPPSAALNSFFAYRHFQAIGSELEIPKILICPTDSRAPAASFAELQNTNVSYFVNTAAEYQSSDSVLAGDRNLSSSDPGFTTVLRLGDKTKIEWTHEMHQFRGNLLFTDARVESTSKGALASAFGSSTGRGAMTFPATPPASAGGGSMGASPPGAFGGSGGSGGSSGFGGGGDAGGANTASAASAPGASLAQLFQNPVPNPVANPAPSEPARVPAGNAPNGGKGPWRGLMAMEAAPMPVEIAGSITNKQFVPTRSNPKSVLVLAPTPTNALAQESWPVTAAQAFLHTPAKTLFHYWLLLVLAFTLAEGARRWWKRKRQLR